MFLLDTNHCSLLLNGDTKVVAQLQAHSDSPVSTSVISQGELTYMSQASQRQIVNAQRISSFLSGIRIYPVSSEAARIYGQLKADIFDHFGPKEKARRRHTAIQHLGFSDNDLWIAAIALEHEATIVSCDSDFTRMREVVKLQLVDWTT